MVNETFENMELNGHTGHEIANRKEIRDLFAKTPHIKVTELSKIYGVSESLLYKVRKGYRW